MKAVLEFDLNDRDDDMAHKRCIKALDMALVIWDFTYNSKKTLKSKIETDKITDPYEVLDLVYQHFNELCNEEVVNIDSLIE
jgi:hypothetical protein